MAARARCFSLTSTGSARVSANCGDVAILLDVSKTRAAVLHSPRAGEPRPPKA